MLTYIHIKDLAIVSSVELELKSGMTALTGETGAGKSILIDALGLALGDKADNDMIRSGCGRAEIVAAFETASRPGLQDWLREQSMDEDDELILRRVLVRDGRSRAFVNGRPTPLPMVQELGRQLVDIQGQQAHQSLVRPSVQRALLDAYGGLSEKARELASTYRDYRSAQTRLVELKESTSDRVSRLDLLRYQANELDEMRLREGELEELEYTQTRLSNIGELQESCATILRELDQNEHNLTDILSLCINRLEEILNLDSSIEESRSLLEDARIQVQEAVSSLREYAEGLEADPAELARVDSRLGQLHDLARKYRVRPEELGARLHAIREELEEIEHEDVSMEQLEREVSELRERYLKQARELGPERAESGKALSETITSSMQSLGMEGGQFKARIDELPEEQGTAAGLQQIEFLVSANPGLPVQPLAKVASGGELSRISLAVHLATVECGPTPTLIFDEVDVGIGGRVAEIVGQMLRRLGENRQVLCVTHLPQVAAQGHHHFQVKKRRAKQETHTGVHALSAIDRIEEIARMLGGVEITEQTLAHAREMVEQAGNA